MEAALVPQFQFTSCNVMALHGSDNYAAGGLRPHSVFVLRPHSVFVLRPHAVFCVFLGKGQLGVGPRKIRGGMT